MRGLWAQFGRPGQKEPGKVATPYTIDGLKEKLAKVAGDRGFANDFFCSTSKAATSWTTRACSRAPAW